MTYELYYIFVHKPGKIKQLVYLVNMYKQLQCNTFNSLSEVVGL